MCDENFILTIRDGICLRLFPFNKVLIGHLRKERMVPADNVLENNFCAANPRCLQMDICFNLYRYSSEHGHNTEHFAAT